MITPEDLDNLRTHLAPLCGTVQGALHSADEAVLSHLGEWPELNDAFFGAGLSHMRRMHSIRVLRETVIAPWSLRSTGRNMSFVFNHGAMSLRMLRPMDAAMKTPPPGPNYARQLYFQNLQLELFGIDSSQLIGLWWFDPENREPMIRIVRPVGLWRYNSMERVDVDFMLPGSVEALDDLEFLPTDHDIHVGLPFDDDQDEIGGEARGSGSAG